jgi:hypothetical protein
MVRSEIFSLVSIGRADVIVRFHWDKTDPDAPVWSQAFSTDEGGDLGMELVYAFHAGRREDGDSRGEIKKGKDYDNGKCGRGKNRRRGLYHIDKYVTPDKSITLGTSELKWYDLAPKHSPVTGRRSSRMLARAISVDEYAQGNLSELGDLGFVILHRCGADFYFPARAIMAE